MSKHHAMKVYGGTDIKLHTFSDLPLVVVSFMFQGDHPWYSLGRKVGGSQNHSEYGGENKNSNFS
jgi:hypothetical protein